MLTVAALFGSVGVALLVVVTGRRSQEVVMMLEVV